MKKPNWATNIGKDSYGIYAEFKINDVVQKMRWIEPGKFLMGSPEDEPERYDDEKHHEVILTKGFWLADTACTQALWTAVMGNNPSRFQGAERPVEIVSWNDCQKFITKINKMIEGLNLRLPTEAQWEYACRAGTETPFWFGDNITTDQGNYNGDNPYNNGQKGEYRGQTVGVKELPCNSWGLYQMHGNVCEWCNDWYGEYEEGSIIDPIGPEKGVYRVLRGGSWFNYGGDVRSAYRSNWWNPGNRNDSAGFRISRGQA